MLWGLVRRTAKVSKAEFWSDVNLELIVTSGCTFRSWQGPGLLVQLSLSVLQQSSFFLLLWLYTYVHHSSCVVWSCLFGFFKTHPVTFNEVSFDSLTSCCVGGNLPNVSEVFVWSMMEIITNSTVLPAQILKLCRIFCFSLKYKARQSTASYAHHFGYFM